MAWFCRYVQSGDSAAQDAAAQDVTGDDCRWRCEQQLPVGSVLIMALPQGTSNARGPAEPADRDEMLLARKGRAENEWKREAADE